MNLAAALTATAAAGCLLAAGGPASAESPPPPPEIVDDVVDAVTKPTIAQDKCVVSYVGGRWEIVCVPYGDVSRDLRLGG